MHAGGSGDNGLLAYDEETGELRWSAPAGDHSYSSAQLSTVDGKKCVLMLTNKGVDFIDPENGNVIGSHVSEYDGYRVIQPLVFDKSSVLLGTPMDGTRRVVVNWDGQQVPILLGPGDAVMVSLWFQNTSIGRTYAREAS